MWSALLRAAPTGAFEADHLDRLRNRGVEVAVGDKDVVDAARMGAGHFFPSLAEPLQDTGFVLTFAFSQTTEEFFVAGGKDKDGIGIWDFSLDGDGTLDIDLEDDEAAAFELSFDPFSRRAILAPINPSGFEELVGEFHALELLIADEVIIDPLDIMPGFLACGCGDGKDCIGDGALDAARDGGLSRATGATDDEQHAIIGIGGKAVGLDIGRGHEVGRIHGHGFAMFGTSTKMGG